LVAQRCWREWEKRECYEAVTLPPGIDPEKVNARYHNGVLTVAFLKTEEGKARRIPVKNAQ
jgi:HSP20 family molecular chaperone IbpA